MISQKFSKNKSHPKKFFQSSGNYIILPLEDREKVRELGLGLQDYWLECWQADPFGTRWVELSDDPNNTTQAKYRKQLEELGLFLFEKVGQRGKWRMRCINLHGSRSHLGKKYLQKYVDNYGMPNVPQETVERLNRLLELDVAEPIPNPQSIEQSHDEKTETLDAIEPKTAEAPTNQEKPEASISPQELLKEEVLEENKQLDVWTLRAIYESIASGNRQADAQTLDECYQDVALQPRISHLLKQHPEWGLVIFYGKVMTSAAAEAEREAEPGFMRNLKAALEHLRSRIRTRRDAKWERLKNI